MLFAPNAIHNGSEVHNDNSNTIILELVLYITTCSFIDIKIVIVFTKCDLVCSLAVFDLLSNPWSSQCAEILLSSLIKMGLIMRSNL